MALWIWKKAFDRVPREVIRWAMRKLGVEEWLVSAVMSMYTGAKTVVRTVYGNSSCFEVKVGMHQGSALSPLLFVIVMEAISREFRVALPWELLYADNCKKTQFKKQCKGQAYKTAEIILLCHKMLYCFCTVSFTCELIAKIHSLSCHYKCD